MTQQTSSSVDQREVAHFKALADQWWNPQGALKTLHHINPVRLAYIQDHATIANKRVLDVGCGGALLAEAMAQADAHVSALDADAAAIEVARAHAQEEQLDIDYYCQPLETFEAEPFDVITCLEMLEHVANPSLIIQHASRLLKDDGILILSTINQTTKAYAEVVVAAEYVLGLIPKQTHDYQRFITPANLAAMCRQAGLAVCAIDGMHYQPFTYQATIVDDVRVNYLMIAQKA